MKLSSTQQKSWVIRRGLELLNAFQAVKVRSKVHIIDCQKLVNLLHKKLMAE